MTKMFWIIHLLHFFSFLLVSSKRDVERGCWPFNVIPYRIEKDFSKKQVKHILQQVDELHRSTCVRWINMEEHDLNATDYALFVKTTKRTCFMDGQTSAQGYVAHITLSDVCFDIPSAVIHEMLHVLGFEHEHQRSDRDCYIEVHKGKVQASGKESQYEIFPQEEWLERFPYDKRSVMHYRRDNRMRARSERWYQFEPLGNLDGKLTYLDQWKIRYRFCNQIHFCDVQPLTCEQVDKAEKQCRKSGSDLKQ